MNSLKYTPERPLIAPRETGLAGLFARVDSAPPECIRSLFEVWELPTKTNKATEFNTHQGVAKDVYLHLFSSLFFSLSFLKIN